MKYDDEKRTAHDPMIRERLSRFGSPTAMKRLTIDVPAPLHANVKSICAKRGVKMADAIRELLEDRFGEAD